MNRRITLTMGLIVERRTLKGSWGGYQWRAAQVIPSLPGTAPWTVISQSPERTSWYAGPITLALDVAAASGYRDNLLTGASKIWIALRPDSNDPPVAVRAVSADQAEGEAMTEAGDDVVDAVAMPPEVAEEVALFVAEHFVERGFWKRRRDGHEPQLIQPGQLGDEDG